MPRVSDFLQESFFERMIIVVSVRFSSTQLRNRKSRSIFQNVVLKKDAAPMRRIKIFIDNTIIPADIYAGQKIAFIFLPAGRQTAQGREQVVHQASVENENGRVINVTWQAKGWFNRLVTRHSPLLRRMLGQPDTYRFDDNIASPEFIQERAD
jgi:hypothetical protein